MVERNFSEITPEIKKLDKICENNSRIDPKFYSKYKVFRGLRDLEGKGVLTGLTEISEVYAKKEVDGKLIPCHGQLFYRGINIEDLVKGFIKEDRFGFEETAYLLDLTINSDKPVVITGAMRSGSELGYDGPSNLAASICTAISEDAKGRGVLVCFNGELNSASEVIKANSMALNAFRTPNFGPIGIVDNNKVMFYREAKKSENKLKNNVK